jgi:phosphoribosylaminoimidazole-succinocarboxamide synthase
MAGKIDTSLLRGKPVAVGSVQRMYSCTFEGEDCLLAEALDTGSVFDVGTFFSIAESGALRNSLRHNIYASLGEPASWAGIAALLERYFADSQVRKRLLSSDTLQRLQKSGLRSHHLGQVDPGTGEVIDCESSRLSPLVLIRPFPVIKPVRAILAGQPVYDYWAHTHTLPRVLGLENVIRIGVPRGSHLVDRYSELQREGLSSEADALLAEFGLQGSLNVWSQLPNLTCDWAAKYEDFDRHLDAQEALHISGLNAGQLQEAVDLLLVCTVLLASKFAYGQLTLWDLKWELAYDEAGPILVDTMDHDSMRITSAAAFEGRQCHVHFNKQAVRDYYRLLHPDWHAALGDAKRAASSSGKPFMEVYAEAVRRGRYPTIPEMKPEYLALLSDKYSYVNRAWAKGAGPEAAARLVRRELDFYESQGVLESFVRYCSPERI